MVDTLVSMVIMTIVIIMMVTMVITVRMCVTMVTHVFINLKDNGGTYVDKIINGNSSV